jgi:hypothetical protein
MAFTVPSPLVVKAIASIAASLRNHRAVTGDILYDDSTFLTCPEVDGVGGEDESRVEARNEDPHRDRFAVGRDGVRSSLGRQMALQVHSVMQNAQNVDRVALVVRTNAEQHKMAPLSTLASHVKRH